MSDGWLDALTERAEVLEAEATRLRRAAGEAGDPTKLRAALAPEAESRVRGEVHYAVRTVDGLVAAGLGELADEEAAFVIERLLGEEYGSSGTPWILWDEREPDDE